MKSKNPPFEMTGKIFNLSLDISTVLGAINILKQERPPVYLCKTIKSKPFKLFLQMAFMLSKRVAQTQLELHLQVIGYQDLAECYVFEQRIFLQRDCKDFHSLLSV
jgi:hypothetical protein